MVAAEGDAFPEGEAAGEAIAAWGEEDDASARGGGLVNRRLNRPRGVAHAILRRLDNERGDHHVVGRELGLDDEARAAAAIRHPNIIEVYTVGCDKGHEFIAMEFVEGGSLADLLKREGRLPPDRALELLKQVASCLAKAHAVGVLHRDIKPGNLLLTSDGLVKVADFGLAKHEGVDVSVTASGAALGTPLYMAPEVSEGHPADPRSDLYSLGATFYQAIAGRPPFDGQTPAELVRKRLTTEVTPLVDLAPACPPPLSRIIHRLLQKDPADRYASAQSLLETLNAIESRAAPEPGTDSSTAPLGPALRKAVVTGGPPVPRSKKTTDEPSVATAGLSTSDGKVSHAERSRGISPKAPEKRDSSTSQGSARNDREGEPAVADGAPGSAEVPPRRLGKRRWRIVLAAAAALVALLAAAYFLFLRPSERPADAPGEVVLRTGKLLFRTERFEPSGHNKLEDMRELLATSARNVSEVELAFQLINDSREFVTLSSLKVVSIGSLTVKEDSLGTRVISSMRPKIVDVAEARTDLGALDVLVNARESHEERDDGVFHLLPPRAWDLLSPERLEVVQPGGIRSFVVRVRCKRTELACDVVEYVPLRRGGLASLDFEPPEAQSVDHVFNVVVDILGEGERHLLYSDWVYALIPTIDSLFVMLTEDVRGSLPLRKWYALPPEEFVRQAVPRAVKAHSETLAYTIAKESGCVPTDFDADTVSAYCYYHDWESRFRRRGPATKTGAVGTAKQPRAASGLYGDAYDDSLCLTFGRRIERSNLVPLLAGVAKEHPVLWGPMEAELKRMEGCGDKVLERKARFVREQLEAAKRPRPPEPSP